MTYLKFKQLFTVIAAPLRGLQTRGVSFVRLNVLRCLSPDIKQQLPWKRHHSTDLMESDAAFVSGKKCVYANAVWLTFTHGANDTRTSNHHLDHIWPVRFEIQMWNFLRVGIRSNNNNNKTLHSSANCNKAKWAQTWWAETIFQQLCARPNPRLLPPNRQQGKLIWNLLCSKAFAAETSFLSLTASGTLETLTISALPSACASEFATFSKTTPKAHIHKCTHSPKQQCSSLASLVSFFFLFW